MARRAHPSRECERRQPKAPDQMNCNIIRPNRVQHHPQYGGFPGLRQTVTRYSLTLGAKLVIH